jgi:heme/copper-type cytochrome/quinol oxidase subunit 2
MHGVDWEDERGMMVVMVVMVVMMMMMIIMIIMIMMIIMIIMILLLYSDQDPKKKKHNTSCPAR